MFCALPLILMFEKGQKKAKREKQRRLNSSFSYDEVQLSDSWCGRQLRTFFISRASFGKE